MQLIGYLDCHELLDIGAGLYHGHLQRRLVHRLDRRHDHHSCSTTDFDDANRPITGCLCIDDAGFRHHHSLDLQFRHES